MLSFAPKRIYDRIMRDNRYQNKFRSFYWRDLLVHLLASCILLSLLSMVALYPMMVLAAALPFSAACAVIPVIHFHRFGGKGAQE